MFFVFAADSLDSANVDVRIHIALPSLFGNSGSVAASPTKALGSVCRSGDTIVDGVTASFKRQ